MLETRCSMCNIPDGRVSMNQWRHVRIGFGCFICFGIYFANKKLLYVLSLSDLASGDLTSYDQPIAISCTAYHAGDC